MIYPKIRNFSIIAHVDHGKSTLADRILELTGALSNREMKNQFLDKMELERERGITIKFQTVRLFFKSQNKQTYTFNLIDTPGHIDFTHEVSRSLYACEGALLVIDASQGIEAQTVSNVNMALKNKLTIIPVINKIDLKNAKIKEVKEEIKNIINIDTSNIILVSSKYGNGIHELLEAIVKHIPPPKGNKNNPLQAIIFDSWFNKHRGIVILVRVIEGKIKSGSNIYLISSKQNCKVNNLGVFTPHHLLLKKLEAGSVGFIITNIKNINNIKVGDTITSSKNIKLTNLTKIKNIKSKVFAGLFPTNNIDVNKLNNALQKLSLNDAALTFKAENSTALGLGFKCGFLGLLHMDIIKERLEREFNLKLIITSPTVIYKGYLKSNKEIIIDSPAKMPTKNLLKYIKEPLIKAKIFTPSKYLGLLITLCQKKRGKQKSIHYSSESNIIITYIIPMSEIVLDFFDQLKSISKGYASFDYESYGYQQAKLVKIDIILNGITIDALSIIAHINNAYYKGKEICQNIKTKISRQQYSIIIQAAINGKIIIRENIPALRKDVTAKCYGGDVSRKHKLLEKQKKGKKRMKKIGKLAIKYDTFLSLLKI